MILKEYFQLRDLEKDFEKKLEKLRDDVQDF
jgi:hypothetical protein